MATATTLLTAEEYAQLPPGDFPTELVKGIVEETNLPGVLHGSVCHRIGYLLQEHLDARAVGGLVTCNDAGIITQRGPDTVRGADVAYFGIDRILPGTVPKGYAARPPEIVFEVLSPFDRWPRVLVKVGEYLAVGVDYVCVADPATRTVHLYTSEGPGRTLDAPDALEFPGVLNGFSVTVGDFFAE